MHLPRLLLATLLTASWVRTETAPEVRKVKGRWLVFLLAAGVLLDLIVGLALGYVAVQARNAASAAHISRVAAYQFCLANNDAKQSDLARWDAIVALLRTGPDSPQLQAFIEGVEAANGNADAPRDCGKFVK